MVNKRVSMVNEEELYLIEDFLLSNNLLMFGELYGDNEQIMNVEEVEEWLIKNIHKATDILIYNQEIDITIEGGGVYRIQTIEGAYKEYYSV